MKHNSKIDTIKVKILASNSVDLTIDAATSKETYSIEDFIDSFKFEHSFNLFSEYVITEINNLIQRKSKISLNDQKTLKEINHFEWAIILSNIPNNLLKQKSKHLSLYSGSTAIYIIKHTD